MKAISIYEPWGTAIARGLKGNETRGWSTSYRGLLAVHCAKFQGAAKMLWDGKHPDDHGMCSVMRDALATVGVRSMEDLAFGCVVAVAMLKRVVPVETIAPTLTPVERAFGNYDPGRFAWQLEDVRRLAQPVPFRGAQGFFTVPDHLLVA